MGQSVSSVNMLVRTSPHLSLKSTLYKLRIQTIQTPLVIPSGRLLYPTLEGSAEEAAFVTGMEQNSDVVLLPLVSVPTFGIEVSDQMHLHSKT